MFTVLHVITATHTIIRKHEKRDTGTALSASLVIEMPNFLTKFLIDMVIRGEENNEWLDHLIEELESLKTAIENYQG